MPTLGVAISQSTQLLAITSDSARLDAELLIAHVLEIPRTRFITDPDLQLDEQQLEKIHAVIQRRAQGEPVAYLTGSKHFWDLEIKVTSDVLIPRPDTELLVETALTLYPPDESIKVIDLGTGSGAIALAIAKARPHWHITATDASQSALNVAIENAERYRLHNVTLIQSDWFSNIVQDNKFDLVLSNPPYIPDNDPHLSQGDLRFEPQQALRAGPDGLDAIRYLIPTSKLYLQPSGWLMLEHGYDQGEAVRNLFTEHGYGDVQQKKDLGGHVRVTMGRLS